jgi:small subunit ribosomal protein S13
MAKKTETKKAPAEKVVKPQHRHIAGSSGKELKGIVRICGKDVNGALELEKAVMYVQGVGMNLSSVLSGIISNELKVDLNTQVGDLTEQQLDQIEQIIRNPQKYNLPHYLYNRQSDPITGKHVHLISNDLVLSLREDVQKEITSRSWKGARHQTRKGKVRGQSTRSSGRGGIAVGVIRRAVRAKMGGTGAGAKQSKEQPKKDSGGAGKGKKK